MPKRHWNNLKNDATIENEKQNRKKLRKQRNQFDLINQCDGCKLDLPIENGIHVHVSKEEWGDKGWGRLHMACTKNLYVNKKDE